MMIRYSPCNLAPGVHLPLHRSDFKKLTTELERRFVDPRKFKDGWRSPLSTDPTMIQMSQSGYDEEAAIKSAMMLVWDHTDLVRSACHSMAPSPLS